MTVYYITLILVVLLGYLAENADTPERIAGNHLRMRHSSGTAQYFFLVVCVLIFVAGFRYRVGTDYVAYYRGYGSYIKGLQNSLRSLDAPGYGILAWIATRFYDDGAAAIFVASLVTISLPMLVIYRSTDKLLMAAFLFFACYWDGSFNGVRQYLAASMLFCGLSAIKERKVVKYLFITFLAFLFHRSAIVMVILYFVADRKINRINILLLIVAAGVALVSYDQILSFAGSVMDKEYSMDIGYTVHHVNRLRVIAACLPTVVFLYYYQGRDLSRTESFYLNMMIYHSAIRVFTMNSALLYRIGIYTTLFQVIAVPELLKGISENNRKFITTGLVFMYLGLWWYEIYNSGSLNHFQWIWNR